MDAGHPDFQIDPLEGSVAHALRTRSTPRAGAEKFSSRERLLGRLIAARHLNIGVFRAGQVLAPRGAKVETAHVLTRGRVAFMSPDGEVMCTIGPGGVIGLAEGIADTPWQAEIVALTQVTTRMFPMRMVMREMRAANPGLKALFRVIAARVQGASDAQGVPH